MRVSVGMTNDLIVKNSEEIKERLQYSYVTGMLFKISTVHVFWCSGLDTFWPTILCKVAPLAHCVVCLSSSSSVTFCIVAKPHILAKNCLKDQIGLPLRLPHGTNSDPSILPIMGIIQYKGLCLLP